MRAVYIRRRIAVGLTFVAALIGFVNLIDAGPQFSCDVDNVKAVWGDTLWGIAEKHCTGDHQAAVETMIGLNRGTDIKAGQIVDLP